MLLSAGHGMAVFGDFPVQIVIQLLEIEAVGNTVTVYRQIFVILAVIGIVECHILIPVLDFPCTRMNVQVWADKPVAAEIAVVPPAGGVGGRIAVVAAVGPVETALGILFGKALVHPVPDKAALKVGIAVDRIPVEVERTGAVAHCVGVFALHHRLSRRLASLLRFPGGRSVHGIQEIRIGAAFSPFVDHGTVLPACLELSEGTVGVGEIDSVAGLVSEGKNGHAGIIGRARIHVKVAFHVHGKPLYMLCQRTLAVTHSMALQVGFVVYIEAETVAELVESPLLRIMAGADGVDVERTHHLEVLQYLVAGEVVAGKLVVFVKINALELDGLAVHIEDVALYLEAAEAHVEAGVLPFRLEQQGVEFRGLGSPAAHARNTQILHRSGAGRDHAAVGIQKLEPHRSGNAEREKTVGAAPVKR